MYSKSMVVSWSISLMASSVLLFLKKESSNIVMIGLKLLLSWLPERLQQLRQHKQPTTQAAPPMLDLAKILRGEVNLAEHFDWQAITNQVIEKDTNMNVKILLAQLLTLGEAVASFTIHDSHKLNILDAAFAGVKAAIEEYEQSTNVAPSQGETITPLAGLNAAA